ncbi:hypothetical protein DINM_000067 [Dirofilaria immitis]|nr:hypothetical protein [Dirofilaria immitis]
MLVIVAYWYYVVSKWTLPPAVSNDLLYDIWWIFCVLDQRSSSSIVNASNVYTHWRKALKKKRKRLRQLSEKVRELSDHLKVNGHFQTETKKLAKRLPMLPLNFHTVQSSPHTLLITKNKNFKIKRLHSSINQSKNGESGGICLGHNDCKPGLCCHHISSMDANSSIISTTNTCYQYMLKKVNYAKIHANVKLDYIVFEVQVN